MNTFLRDGSRMDADGLGNVTVAEPHARVHAGKSFYSVLRNVTVVKSGGVYRFKLVPPASPHIHLLWYLTADSELLLDIYKGCTSVAAGTAWAQWNRKHDGPATGPFTTLEYNAGARAGGTNIYPWIIPAGDGGPLALSADARSEQEIIFQPSAIYAVELTNNSAVSDAVFSTLISYYRDD